MIGGRSRYDEVRGPSEKGISLTGFFNIVVCAKFAGI